jgi:hypothetical protein
MENIFLNINDESVTTLDNKTVMHIWETPIMKEKANWVCSNGGDIIEFGFGMGISASFIQNNNINSHTICEINPYILEKLYKWSEDKKNVRIVEGDWFNNIELLEKYDGILFDTHNDRNITFFFEHLIYKISKKGTKLTWWNNLPQPYGRKKPKETLYEVLNVNPPENDYFNHKQYFFPKYIFE